MDLSCNTFVSGEVGRRFKFKEVNLDIFLPRTRHSCGISLKGVVLPAGVMTLRWAPPTVTSFGVEQDITVKRVVEYNQRFRISF